MKNRFALSELVNGTILIITTAGCTVSQPLKEDRKKGEKGEAVYSVCVAYPQELCPSGTINLSCSTSIADWAAQQCVSHDAKLIKASPGGVCGIVVTQVRCTIGK